MYTFLVNPFFLLMGNPSSSDSQRLLLGALAAVFIIGVSAGFVGLYLKLDDVGTQGRLERQELMSRMIGLDGRMDRLESSQSKSTSSVAMSNVKQGTLLSATQTIRAKEYEFLVPSSWKAERNGSQTSFYEGGREIAILNCPMPETGYEDWKFEDRARYFVKNGKEYGVELKLGLGDPKEPNPELALLWLFPQARFEYMEQKDYQNTCQLIGQQQNLFDVFTEIYRSVR